MAASDPELERDPSDEGEEDLQPADLRAIEQAAVYSADWTAETILSQLRRGNIELNPTFQRRDAWQDDRKSEFIESLLLGLPIPQLVLAEQKDRRGGFIVIDGKQRLTTLWRFASNDENNVPLRLRELKVRSDLNGLTFADMSERENLSADVAFFENQTIRTVVLRAWPDDDFLFRVFHRLNSGSVSLSPQELRQALIPGEFVSFVERRSGDSLQIQRILNRTTPDFRMRDAELLVRFFAFASFLPQYDGNLKGFLDTACRELNQRWAKQRDDIEAFADACDEAIDATYEIFGKNAFRRWADGQYEGRFNRAIFDVMVFYFRRPSIARLAIENSEAVESAYKQLSETESEFVEAVQSTTKTIPATYRRLALWGATLERALGEKLRIPEFDEEANRIVLVK